MAVLSDADRQAAFVEFLRLRNEVRDPVECTKANVRLSVNAIDDFLNANAAAINAAFPLPARTQLSTQQKLYIVHVVILFRLLAGA